MTSSLKDAYELVRSGASFAEQIKSNDGLLPTDIFDLKNLNCLSLTNACIRGIPEILGNLENLSTLELHTNEIVELPQSLGTLTKLKHLDVSNNQLVSLPDSFKDLISLNNLNLSNNKLTLVPDLRKCSHLAHVDMGHNELSSFKELCCPELSMLTEIRLPGNCITVVPVEVASLALVKTVDLSDNKIVEVPKNVLDAPKLKELNLTGNPLSDKRFKKLVEQKRSQPKQVIDYIRKHCQAVSQNNLEPLIEKLKIETESSAPQIKVLGPKDAMRIYVTAEAKCVRPYLVSCILRNIDLTEPNFKRFINLQTKLHEGICKKRVAATIATHDFSRITCPLHYKAKEPQELHLKPLGNNKIMTAIDFYKILLKDVKHQQTRNKISAGIFKYVHLVKELKTWPYLEDASETVISLPPLTNAYDTKLSQETKDVLMEVTSAISLATCKEAMDACIYQTLKSGIFSSGAEGGRVLQVEQVRVVDENEGNLRVLYPSRLDLDFGEEIRVVRD